MSKATQVSAPVVRNASAKAAKFNVTLARKPAKNMLDAITSKAVQIRETATNSSQALITLARDMVASDPALRGMTEEFYKAHVHAGVVGAVNILPIASKGPFVTWCKAHILAASHGITSEQNALDKAAGDFNVKLRKAGVLATGKVRGPKKRAEQPAPTPAQAEQGKTSATVGAPLAPPKPEPGKVVSREDLLQCAMILVGREKVAAQLVALVTSSGGVDELGKYLNARAK